MKPRRTLYELTQDFVYTPEAAASLQAVGNFFPDYFRVNTLFPSDAIADLSNVAVFLPGSLADLWTQLLQTSPGRMVGVGQLCIPYVACVGSMGLDEAQA
eukprot:3286041-Pyramimonas_sp.AAC.1